jgi:uncharacterized alkaline shock family protein YloU
VTHADRGGVIRYETDWGWIEVSPLAIAAIASGAALECYGVVGMASRSLRDGLGELLARDASHRGVEVQLREGAVGVDLYIIMEYGVRISEVARNVMSLVHFRLEKALGMPVAYVNVHVQGLRVSLQDERR